MEDKIEVLDTYTLVQSNQETNNNQLNELEETQNNNDNVINNSNHKKRSIPKIIAIIILTLVILLILIETIVGIIDVGQIKDNKKPMWYLNSDVQRINDKTITTYDLGLYVIEKKESRTEIKIILKPFFME